MALAELLVEAGLQVVQHGAAVDRRRDELVEAGAAGAAAHGVAVQTQVTADGCAATSQSRRGLAPLGVARWCGATSARGGRACRCAGQLDRQITASHRPSLEHTYQPNERSETRSPWVRTGHEAQGYEADYRDMAVVSFRRTPL